MVLLKLWVAVGTAAAVAEATVVLASAISSTVFHYFATLPNLSKISCRKPVLSISNGVGTTVWHSLSSISNGACTSLHNLLHFT